MTDSEMRLESARDAAYAEDQRSVGLQNRAAVIAAASGVVLGIVVTMGRSTAFREVAGSVLGALLLVTLLFLLAAGLLAGRALWPPSAAGPSINDLRAMASETFGAVTQSSLLIEALTDQVSDTRADNQRNARRLRGGLIVLGLGLLGTTLIGVKLAFESPDDRPRSGQMCRESALEATRCSLDSRDSHHRLRRQIDPPNQEGRRD